MNLHHNPELRKALIQAARLLNPTGGRYLLGGSASLLLQGVALAKAPRDIDIYADVPAIGTLHASLLAWAEDEPHKDSEGMYESILSHYTLEGYPVELVGGFKVVHAGSAYHVEVEDLLYNHSVRCDLGGAHVPLMPLSHELAFNVLRGRSDRCEAIGNAIQADPAPHRDILASILDRNEWSEVHRSRILELSGARESS